MIDKLESLKNKFLTVEEQISDPHIIQDLDRYTKLNKEYAELKPYVEAYNKLVLLNSNILNAKEIIAKEKDLDMKEMAKEELESLIPSLNKLDEDIRVMLIPKDPEDTKDAIIEIRSGTGGDEASIFAGDLFRMYSKYFDIQGWKTEILSVNEGTHGGYNKIEVEVTGLGVFGFLKFESGAHRVQRIPKTESQGRVHTSAATVAVMPILEFEDVDIKKSDIKTDTFRASGAGGQHVNKTESGVRFTHLPTGIVTESTEARSQIKNREIAMSRLISQIQKLQRDKVFNEQAEMRKSLVGSGDRSDKIRTYNYPQNRVTDHRINLTLYNLDQIMEGAIMPIIEELRLFENASKLEGVSKD